MDHLQGNTNNKFLYHSIPALPIVLGEAVVFSQSGVSPLSLLIGALLIVSSIGVGAYLWHRRTDELNQINSRWQQDQNDQIEAIVTYTSELERLLLTISPILSQHVMVSREHTEQEIISLTYRFSDMVQRLQQIVINADSALGGSSYNPDNIISTSHELLKPALNMLNKVHQEGHEVWAGLQKLSGRTVELKTVVSDVNDISVRLEQFALSLSNASSDSEPGQSSTAIADQAGKLAHDFLDVFKRLEHEVNDVALAAETALQIAESVQLDDTAIRQTEANIDQTLSHLGQVLAQYRDNACLLRNNAEQIQDEINNVLVTLQFQDRVSQILTQVENNLLNMQKTIESIQQQGNARDVNMLKVDEAVEHIEEKYKSVGSYPEHASDNSDDLTFF
ncbi:MAG: hypothetical protein ACXWAS_08020 [Methylobacter sp.]